MDCNTDGDADYICNQARPDAQQGARPGQHSEKAVGPSGESIALNRTCQAVSADAGGDKGPHNAQRIALVQQDIIVNENEGQNKSIEGQLKSGISAFRWVTLGNARSCVRGQSHRRRNIGNDAKVEHEQMCRNGGNSHIDDCRCHQGRQDQIAGRGRHTHSQNQRSQRGNNQQQPQPPVCDLYQYSGEPEGEAGTRNRAHDNADHGTSQGYAAAASPGGDKELLGRLPVQPGIPEAGAEDQRKDNGDDSGPGDGGAEDADQHDQQCHWRQQIDPAQADFYIRHFRPLQSSQAAAEAVQIYHEIQGKIVEYRGNKRRFDHVPIRDAQDFGDEECGSGHDRGHN